jgi:hypothetical protein
VGSELGVDVVQGLGAALGAGQDEGAFGGGDRE